MKISNYDVVIIGSGFGGSMTAKKLSAAGYKVAIIERGDWVNRGAENWHRKGSIDLTKHYDNTTQYNVLKGGNKKKMGVYAAVGGPSVFYGGVSFRFREKDFEINNEIVNDSNAFWPIGYSDLEKYYCEAESILQIAGNEKEDLTSPPRSKKLPFTINTYAEISLKIKDAAISLGLHPSRLPLAINYQNNERKLCQLCTTCDTFACAIKAKNDLDTMILSNPQNKNIDVYPNLVVTRLIETDNKITEIKAKSKQDGKMLSFSSNLVILSAGALASAHIVLSSGLQHKNPAGEIIGKYLMRHVNSIVFGVFPGIADKEYRFHKELAIMDYYFGSSDNGSPRGKLGSLQQVATPPGGLVENVLPYPIGKVLSKGVGLLTGLLAIAEDQPQKSNQLNIDQSSEDIYGLKNANVSHEYSSRDLQAVRFLSKKAKNVLKSSGAIFSYTHNIRTFSHAVGTIRMGDNEKENPLDKYCKFRGLRNLFVIDGSFFPTSGGVNPSLTISANALRVSDFIINEYEENK